MQHIYTQNQFQSPDSGFQPKTPHLRMDVCGLLKDLTRTDCAIGTKKNPLSYHRKVRIELDFNYYFTFSFIRNKNPDLDVLVTYDKPMPPVSQEDFIACPVKKGSLVVIHGLVIHQSESNRSDKSRYAYTFHVMETLNVKYSPDNWLQLPEGEQFAPLF